MWRRGGGGTGAGWGRGKYSCTCQYQPVNIDICMLQDIIMLFIHSMRLAPLLAPSFYLCVKSKGKVLTGCNDCISTHDDIIYPKVVFFSELCPGRGLSCDHLSSVQIDLSILYLAVDISILHTAVYKQLTYTLSLTLAFCSNIQI